MYLTQDWISCYLNKSKTPKELSDMMYQSNAYKMLPDTMKNDSFFNGVVHEMVCMKLVPGLQMLGSSIYQYVGANKTQYTQNQLDLMFGPDFLFNGKKADAKTHVDKYGIKTKTDCHIYLCIAENQPFKVVEFEDISKNYLNMKDGKVLLEISWSEYEQAKLAVLADLIEKSHKAL